uniref:Transposase n=1 Tax=Ascaris lumbricoides TaxID=6252 RepID=A0A0M3I445_ASCLU
MTPRFGIDSCGGLSKDQSYAGVESRALRSLPKRASFKNGRFNALQRRPTTGEGEAMIPHAAVVKKLNVLKKDGRQQPRRIVSFCAISVLNDVVLFTVDTVARESQFSGFQKAASS